MLEAAEPILETIAQTVDLIGVGIVVFGALKFLVAYARIEARRLGRRACAREIQQARSALGTYILVALEFMIVSDVISSVVSRTLEALAYLAAVVAVRTAMGYFLGRELREDEESA